MILTVTLNAAIDKTYVLPRFEPGGLFRATDVLSLPGGKGINVARVACSLGCDVTASGFVAGYNGKYIVEGCSQAGITPSFIETEGESRICMTFLDQSTDAVTEVLESGPTMGQHDLDAFCQHLGQLAKGAQYVIFSGSLPKGLPTNTYRQLVQLVKQTGAVPVVDSSGAALAAALEARPFLIKPNQPEAEALLGYALDSLEAKRRAVAELHQRGAEHVLLSLGSEGAILSDGNRLYQLPVLPIERLVNPVGCGDSLLAGLIAGLMRGWTLAEAARLGTACAAANALSLGAGIVQPEDVERFLVQAVVQEMSE